MTMRIKKDLDEEEEKADDGDEGGGKEHLGRVM